MLWAGIGLAVVVGLILVLVLVGYCLPKGHVASETRSFPVRTQVIWDLLVDYPRQIEWRTNLKSMEKVGADEAHPTWCETTEDGTKLTLQTTEAQAPTRLVRTITDKSLPFGGNWVYELRPTPEGCTLTITENGEVYNPIFRVVSRFLDQAATIKQFLGHLENRVKRVKP